MKDILSKSNRILSVLLALVLAATYFPLSVFAAEDNGTRRTDLGLGWHPGSAAAVTYYKEYAEPVKNDSYEVLAPGRWLYFHNAIVDVQTLTADSGIDLRAFILGGGASYQHVFDVYENASKYDGSVRISRVSNVFGFTSNKYLISYNNAAAYYTLNPGGVKPGTYQSSINLANPNNFVKIFTGQPENLESTADGWAFNDNVYTFHLMNSAGTKSTKISPNIKAWSQTHIKTLEATNPRTFFLPFSIPISYMADVSGGKEKAAIDANTYGHKRNYNGTIGIAVSIRWSWSRDGGIGQGQPFARDTAGGALRMGEPSDLKFAAANNNPHLNPGAVNARFRNCVALESGSWWDVSEASRGKTVKSGNGTAVRVRVAPATYLKLEKRNGSPHVVVDWTSDWYKAMNTVRQYLNEWVYESPSLESWLINNGNLTQEKDAFYAYTSKYLNAQAGILGLPAIYSTSWVSQYLVNADDLVQLSAITRIFMYYYEIEGFGDEFIGTAATAGRAISPKTGYRVWNSTSFLVGRDLIVDSPSLYNLDASEGQQKIELHSIGVDNYGIPFLETVDELEMGTNLEVVSRIGLVNLSSLILPGAGSVFQRDDIRLGFTAVLNDADRSLDIQKTRPASEKLFQSLNWGTPISGFTTTWSGLLSRTKRNNDENDANCHGLLLPMHPFQRGYDAVAAGEIKSLVEFLGNFWEFPKESKATGQQYNEYTWNYTIPTVDDNGQPVTYIDIYVHIAPDYNWYRESDAPRDVVPANGLHSYYPRIMKDNTRLFLRSDNMDISNDFARVRIKIKPWDSDIILGSETRENAHPEKMKAIEKTNDPAVDGQQTTSMLTVPNGVSTQSLPLTDEDGNVTQSPTIDISGRQLNTIKIVGVNGEEYTDNPDNRPGEGDWVTLLVPIERTFDAQLGAMDKDPMPLLLGDFGLMARPYINLPETAAGATKPDIAKRIKEIIAIDYGLPLTYYVGGQYGGAGNDTVRARIVGIEYFDYDIPITEADIENEESILAKRLQDPVPYDSATFKNKPFTTGTRLIIEYSYKIPTKEILANPSNFSATEAGKYHPAFYGKTVESFVLEFYIHADEEQSWAENNPFNIVRYNDFGAIRIGWPKPYKNISIIEAAIYKEGSSTPEVVKVAEKLGDAYRNITIAKEDIEPDKLYYAVVTVQYVDSSGLNKPSELSQFEALVVSDFNGERKESVIYGLPKGSPYASGSKVVFDYKTKTSTPPTSTNVTSASQIESTYTMIMPINLGKETLEGASSILTFDLDRPYNLPDNTIHTDWEQITFTLSARPKEPDNAITEIKIYQKLNGVETDITDTGTINSSFPVSVTGVKLSPDYKVTYTIETTVTRMVDSITDSDITNALNQMKYEIFNGEILMYDTPKIKESSNGNKLDKEGDTVTFISSYSFKLNTSTNLIVSAKFLPPDVDLINNAALLTGDARIDFVAEELKVYPEEITIPGSNPSAILGAYFGEGCTPYTSKSTTNDPQLTFRGAVSYNDPSGKAHIPEMYTNFDTINVQILMYSSPVGGGAGGAPQKVWEDNDFKIAPGQTLQIQGNLNSNGTKNGTGKIEWKANYEYRFVLVVNGGNGNPASRTGRKFNYEADWTNNESWDTMRVQGGLSTPCPEPCKSSNLNIFWGPVTFSYTECPKEEWYDCPCATYTTVTTTDSKGNTSTSTYCSALKIKGCCRGIDCKSWTTDASFKESYSSKVEIRGTYSNGNWVPANSSYKISAGEWFEFRVITSYTTNRGNMPPPNPYGGCAYLRRNPGYASPPAYRTVAIRWTNSTGNQSEGWVTNSSGWTQTHSTQRFQVPEDAGPITMKLEWTTLLFYGYVTDGEHPQSLDEQLCEAARSITLTTTPIDIKEGTTQIN